MNSTEKLKLYLPEFVSEGAVITDILSQDAAALDELSADRLSLFEQMFVESGTWGLKLWEIFLDLVVDESKPTEFRRNNIKAKIQASAQIFTKEMLRKVLVAYGYSVFDIIERFDEYLVEVQISNTINNARELRVLAKYLRAMFPAHLNCRLVTMNKTTSTCIDIPKLGPIVAPRSVVNNKVYVLESSPQLKVSDIAKYNTAMGETYTRVPLATNYPDYDFDSLNAAGTLSRVFMTCSKKVKPIVPLAKRVLRESNINITARHTDEAAETVKTLRYTVGSSVPELRVQSISIKKNVMAPTMYWQTQKLHTPAFWEKSSWDLWECYFLDPENPSGYMDDSKIVREFVSSTAYQFFDINNQPLSEKVFITEADGYAIDATPTVYGEWNYKVFEDGCQNGKATWNIELTNFPAGTYTVEVTHVVKRPDPKPRTRVANDNGDGGGPNCEGWLYYHYFPVPEGYNLDPQYQREVAYLTGQGEAFYGYDGSGPWHPADYIAQHTMIYQSHQESIVTITTDFNYSLESIDTANNTEMFLADVNTATGVATFYELHELLGLPKIIRSFYEERFNPLSVKLHTSNLGDQDNATGRTFSLAIVCGHGAGYQAAGTFPTMINEMGVYRFTIPDAENILEYVGKKTIKFDPILKPGFTALAIDDPSVPAYHSDNIIDFIGTPDIYVQDVMPSLVRRYETWIDDDAYHYSLLINAPLTSNTGEDHDHLVSLSRKRKYYVYEYFAVGEYAGYLGSCIRQPSFSEFIKCPSIKIVDLTTMEMKTVDNPELLELCRTSASFSQDYMGGGFGHSCVTISESASYGIPFPFIRVRTPAVSMPALDGSAPDNSYEVGRLLYDNGTPVINGLKFSMVVVNPESFNTNLKYQYAYNSGNSSDTYSADRKMPLYPTNIMPDLTLWMDTAFDLSKAGMPALDNFPENPQSDKYYPTANFGSFYYPYVSMPFANIEPFDPSVLTAGKVKTLYMGSNRIYSLTTPYNNLFSNQEGGTLYVAYDNSNLYFPGRQTDIEGGEAATTGIKLACIKKVAFNTYDLFTQYLVYDYKGGPNL